MFTGKIIHEQQQQSGINRGLLLFFVILLSIGCRHHDGGVNPYPDDKGNYTLLAKYDSIRSYPNGGGIFIISLKPDSSFSGTVSLKLLADPSLGATLTGTTLDLANRVAEIVIRPQSSVEIKKYPITIVATHSDKIQTLNVQVSMYQWGDGDIETPLAKRDEFKEWLISNYPKYSSIFITPDNLYHTYPEILIVEHYTYLTWEYEVRFCYHVMVPPSDWSMIQIRKRGLVNAEFAARRETDGSIHTIPVSDYPVLLGY